MIVLICIIYISFQNNTRLLKTQLLAPNLKFRVRVTRLKKTGRKEVPGLSPLDLFTYFTGKPFRKFHHNDCYFKNNKK